jgi:tRNA pseudouridine13 synthase
LSSPLTYPTLAEFAYAFGIPAAQALSRVQPEDFRVDEELGFAPDGEGEHVLVQIRKRNFNTEEAARRLAKFCGVAPSAVSYAGLKDRRAVTTQWFSVWLRNEPDWAAFNSDGLELLQAARHRRKLRRGSLTGNRFTLVLREVSGAADELENRLRQIAAQGVPNYFGSQRFGRGENNLNAAAALFAGTLKDPGRHQRGLYLSAARSFLFNCALSRRVAQQSWTQAIPGEALQLAGSNSFFVVDEADAEIERRLREYDIHPTAPLWGKGNLPSRAAAAQLEQETLAPYAEFRAGLEAAGLEQERRSLRLLVTDLQWQWLADNELQLSFRLPAGAYATSVLRELLQESNAPGSAAIAESE